MVSNKQIIYAKLPTNYPLPGEHLIVKTTEFNLDQPLKNGEFITKILEISLDPYVRLKMRDPSIEHYHPALRIGDTLDGYSMHQVLKSKNNQFNEGDLLYGKGKFAEYFKYDQDLAKSISFVVRNQPKQTGLPVSDYVSILGMPGLTVYSGLFEIAQIKKGETIYISAASGAVGQLAGQIAKANGLYVAGSAGSDEKVAYLKEIGFNAAFNYKTEDIRAKLTEYCPNGIDVYFENVGGETLEIVLDIANPFCRIIGCGMISQYNSPVPYHVKNLMNLIAKRIKFQGLVYNDHNDLFPEMIDYVTELIVNDKVTYKKDIINGIENVPQGFLDMLNGKNFGKAIVHVADL